MSRRINMGADRAAQNQQTLKSLVKLENNKSCADCKRNKHPRWASWNLGIFICIRCSGIHRGMGTHISRVKSVDLDSWTDEQLQSMLRWGNSKANKYWEAKLAPGHVPAEAKIENFIRTKYDSKRWVMDGPMPDPATLGGEADDDVPLNVVQEKAKIERSLSQRNGTSSRAPPAAVSRPPGPAPAPAPSIDLFGDEPAHPARPSTTEPAISARPPPPAANPAAAAPPKQHKPGDSLLGLDFFGGSQATPPQRPASVASGVNAGTQRTDLKQSILSLYASAPKPAAQQQPQQTNAFGGNAFAGLASPALPSPTQQTSYHSNTQSLSGLGDAFGGLNFASPSSQQAAKPNAFATFSSPRSSIASPTSSLAGGGFFDTKPTPVAKTNPPPQPMPVTRSKSGGFGDFGDFTSAAPTATRSPPPPAATSSVGDLFDMASPVTSSAPTPKPAAAPSYSASAFNLSQPAPAPKPAPVQASNFSNLGGMDAWGSSDAWSTPDPTLAPAAPPKQASTTTAASTTTYKAPATTSMSLNDDFGGWGSNDGRSSNTPAKPAAAATVADDDDFGGWSSAEPVSAPSAAAAPAAASSGGDDLFGNVWG
ncbi:putative GTPase activating protein for Arf-domain-containing protein [Delphinella strobiligena]|nr:putative GTPase activating protein for Arf-domain-containing protein [Delphinella strobiligena]